MEVPMKPVWSGLDYARRAAIPVTAWRPANALELASAPGLIPHAVWAELVRLMPVACSRPKPVTVMGLPVWMMPGVVDTDGPRPAMVDADGRRWLLDGSGEVA